MTIKLTRNDVDKNEVLVNWDNVLFISKRDGYYDNSFTEIHFIDKTLEIKESIDEINQIIIDSNNK